MSGLITRTKKKTDGLVLGGFVRCSQKITQQIKNQDCGATHGMPMDKPCRRQSWGVAVLVGVPHKDVVFKIHPVNFLSEKTLTGTYFENYEPKSDLPAIVERYVNKEIEVEKFITHRVPLSVIDKAFDYMLKGESISCIIYMDEEE